jgi:sugar O-acyltransferase (sialic acid O-acetyltransferase NeuD family)
MGLGQESRSKMVGVLILGAGGHGQVVADILIRAYQAGARVCPIGFLDDNPALIGTSIIGIQVLGNIAQLDDIDHDAIIVAIGDNRTRARIFKSVQARGEQIINAIHPSAVVAPDVVLGLGVMICAGVVINTGTVIGDDVVLNTGCTIDHHNRIGDHVHIAPGVHTGGNVTIGEGSLVGIGSIVIPQCTVGAWSVIGAGSVVIRNIPAFATALGVPARVIRFKEFKRQ